MSLWVILKSARVMTILQVECKSCGKQTEVDLRKYNLYKKYEWDFHCPDCKNQKREGRITDTCPVCGKTFTRIKSAKKSKSGLYFCSQSCAATYNNSHYRRGENNPNWIDGSHAGRAYIKAAFRTYKHKCAMCGLTEECCLQVHHIDKNRGNDNPDNLIILCANCHSRIHRGGYNITEEILNNREVAQ